MADLIIGLCGQKGSGKSTIAHYIAAHHGATIIKFADPLKEMMAALGLTDKQIHGYDKEKPSDILDGKTPRFAMQTLGTEWGRDLISKNIWVNAWINRVFKTPGVVVVDDVRFPNEIQAIERLPGVIVWVDRDSIYEPGDTHPSEVSVSSCDCDFMLDNNRQIATVVNELIPVAWAYAQKRDTYP